LRKQESYQLVSLISIKLILMTLGVVLIINGLQITGILLLTGWAIIEILLLRDRKQINEIAVGVHSALQHHNPTDTSYLRFFKSINEGSRSFTPLIYHAKTPNMEANYSDCSIRLGNVPSGLIPGFPVSIKVK